MRDVTILVGLMMLSGSVGCDPPSDDSCPGGCLVGDDCMPARACAPDGQTLCLDGALAPSCGNGYCDCGETFADCADCAGGCDTEVQCHHDGVCWEHGSCVEGALRTCMSGEWIASCGDGTCLLGCEDHDLCPQDCSEDGCDSPSSCPSGVRRWPEGDFCVSSGTCVDDGQICVDGASVPSCGNGECDCGETNETCDDCEPCPPGTCPAPVMFEGIVCVAPGHCQPSYDDEQGAKGGNGGFLCVDGVFVSSCGDGVCGNCGEVDHKWGFSCFEDCGGCGGCMVDEFCLSAGECPGILIGDQYQGLVCDGAELVPSCGDGFCGCEDTRENCPADCP